MVLCYPLPRTPQTTHHFYVYCIIFSALWNREGKGHYFEDTEEYLELFLERYYRYRYRTRYWCNMPKKKKHNGVSYDIVPFLIPNPQRTVSLYTFVFRITAAWSGGKR
jgi:hypothetical protein